MMASVNHRNLEIVKLTVTNRLVLDWNIQQVNVTTQWRKGKRKRSARYLINTIAIVNTATVKVRPIEYTCESNGVKQRK